MVEIENGRARPITPEGIAFAAARCHRTASPSRREPTGSTFLFDVDGGPARPVPGAEGLAIIRWSADGKSIFVGEGSIKSYKVYRLDLSSGRRELWKEFSGSPASDVGLIEVIPTPDGKSYVYGYTTWQGDLFVAEGMK